MSWRRKIALGASAGLLAGMIGGLTEAAIASASAASPTGLYVLFFGAAFYGVATMIPAAAWAVALSRVVSGERALFARTVGPFVGGHFAVLAIVDARHLWFDDAFAVASARGVLLTVAACVLGLLVAVAAVRACEASTAEHVSPWTAPLALGAVLGILALASTASSRVRAHSAGPRGATAVDGSVLVVVVDTLRADHLGAYGQSPSASPRFDAFAADAIRFDRAFSNASWTRPSFASIVTGRYPSSHGVTAIDDAIPPGTTTLATVLHDAGYATAGIVTNENVSAYFGFDAGFDEYTFLEPDFGFGADFASSRLPLVNAARELRWSWLGPLPGTASRDADDVGRAASAWLDRAPAGPWFLFIGYVDPHDPYYTHPYRGPGEGSRALGGVDARDAPHLAALYDEEIRFWDAAFGRLLDELVARGLYDRLTIVVTADHGEEFGDHGQLWHGHTLYDEQLHVPLVVRLPGGRRGGEVVHHCVQSIDVMPTLLGTLDLAVPDEAEGADLFEGSTHVFAQEDHHGHRLESVRRCDASGEVQLVRDRTSGAIELYRVSTDPNERDERAGREPELARELIEILDRGPSTTAVAHRSVTIDAETRRRLGALGYLVDADD